MTTTENLTAIHKAGSSKVHLAIDTPAGWATVCGQAVRNALTAESLAEIYGEPVKAVNCPRCLDQA